MGGFVEAIKCLLDSNYLIINVGCDFVWLFVVGSFVVASDVYMIGTEHVN